jgi:hypothetical protein
MPADTEGTELSLSVPASTAGEENCSAGVCYTSPVFTRCPSRMACMTSMSAVVAENQSYSIRNPRRAA